MADIITPERRSALMSRIKVKDTGIELAVRHGLHALGFRYRLHDSKLFGRPDIALPKYQVVVFVHGCFWHGHHGCPYFRLPKTRADFWQEKINRNRLNDIKNLSALQQAGWRVATVWECALRGPHCDTSMVVQTLGNWIRGTGPTLEISG
jgi:DNA mismatch endonuclease (patch repair protein)